MSITSIPESLIEKFENDTRDKLATLREHIKKNERKNFDEDDSVSQQMLIGAKDILIESKKNLVSRSTFLHEAETGIYQTNYLFHSFVDQELGHYVIFSQQKEAWKNEDTEEIRRLIATEDGVSISDFGLADNLQQIQDYLKKIEPIAELDKNPYFVHVSHRDPQPEEWRKYGPYIGESESTADIPIVKWRIYGLQN